MGKKRYKNLWGQYETVDNFELAYINAHQDKGKQKQVQLFDENKEENLAKTREYAISGHYNTSEYRQKTIYEPKERTIYMLPFMPDRITQHAIMNVMKPIFINSFIDNTFACVEDRGQLKASLKCSEYVRRNKYCLKCDVHKFYPSINQNILSEMLHDIIKDKAFMELLDNIIFSFPGGYNCPIGNYTSQWFGNFYLTVLDNYVYHVLKCHDYERYCDDFLLFSNDKAYLQECKKRIENLLWYELELTYSKAEVFDTKQGVDFCGYRHFGKYVLLRKTTGIRMKKRVADINEAIADGSVDLVRTDGQVASANGLLLHCCSHNFRESLGLDEIKRQIELLQAA